MKRAASNTPRAAKPAKKATAKKKIPATRSGAVAAKPVARPLRTPAADASRKGKGGAARKVATAAKNATRTAAASKQAMPGTRPAPTKAAVKRNVAAIMPAKNAAAAKGPAKNAAAGRSGAGNAVVAKKTPQPARARPQRTSRAATRNPPPDATGGPELAIRHFQELLRAKQERVRRGPAYPPANAYSGRPDAGADARQVEAGPPSRPPEAPAPEAVHGTNATHGRGNQGMRKPK